jgi:hypothetical protein
MYIVRALVLNEPSQTPVRRGAAGKRKDRNLVRSLLFPSLSLRRRRGMCNRLLLRRAATEISGSGTRVANLTTSKVVSPMPKAEWPRLTWRDSGWWMTAIGATMTAVLVIWPSIVEFGILQRALLVALVFTVVPLLTLLAIYVCKFAVAAAKKACSYDRIYQSLIAAEDRALKAQELVLRLQEVADIMSFQISKVQLYDDCLYIIIHRVPRSNLEKGLTLCVIDTRQGGVMGEFELSEIGPSDYTARCTGFVDPLWLGYVRQTGKSECSPPPDTVAIVLPKEMNVHE